MRKILAFALIALTLAACSPTKELKSPCVGLDDSPCGPRRAPVGNHA